MTDKTQPTAASGKYWARLCALPKFSFVLSAAGGVARAQDSCGNWVEASAVQQIVDDAESHIAELKALQAAPPAPTAVAVPEGWTACRIEHEPGYPEDVAFGPQIMMDRLKKWLDRHFAALAAAAAQAVAVPIELQGVKEAVEQGGGLWRSCTGCHELNEGHATGPVSKVFGCALGNGCSECGGIGAVWDDLDYGAMADAMAAPAQEHATQLAGQGQLTWDALRALAIKHGAWVSGYGPFATELLATYGRAPEDQPHWVAKWLGAARAARAAPAQAQEDARDAARWRFLREEHEGEAESLCVFGPNDMRECLVPIGSLPGELDAFIDAARAAQGNA